jgi:hypothetical protein
MAQVTAASGVIAILILLLPGSTVTTVIAYNSLQSMVYVKAEVNSRVAE